MNRVAIYGIIGTIVMLGAFVVLQPLQQANAVHTTLLAGTTQLRTAASLAFAAAPGTRTLSCDAPFDVVTVAIDNDTDATGDNTRTISTDWDGAGATFGATVVQLARALGAAGTDSTDDGLAIAAGTSGTVIVTYADAAGEADAIDTAFGFFTTNSATCAIT